GGSRAPRTRAGTPLVHARGAVHFAPGRGRSPGRGRARLHDRARITDGNRVRCRPGPGGFPAAAGRRAEERGRTDGCSRTPRPAPREPRGRGAGGGARSHDGRGPLGTWSL